MNIFAGIIGAVVGFVAGIFMMEVLGFENRHDPIMSGMLALFVFGPAGAIGSVYLFIWLAMRIRGQAAGAVGSGETVASAVAPTAADASAATGPTSADTPAPAGVAKTGLKS